ncbi:tetratricopeptide repeat protein 24 [Clarias gariepinus]|uniref:tetratricopeptide repeat protein 24 n=1 Tax=Clarias gariepinus TaxID=13013 RepID=UPI00234C867B|nr:tetratricopeptide repeat protein 24 [Clarias gariepinus]XP_053349876.1 tetratricopeptide repeat protein 24 [Clarias gariepinus]
MTPADNLNLFPVMASDGSPPQDSQEKKKKTSRKGKGVDVKDTAVQVERLTACGYSALQQRDSSKALEYFKKAFKTAVNLKETKVQRACAFNLGAAYVEAGKPQKGLDFLSQAEPSERGERMADLQFNIAAAHEALDDHVQAVKHYQQAAQLYRSQGDGSSEGDTCIRLAQCHLRRKEWTDAAENYLRAAESYKVAGKLASAAVAMKDAGNHMLKCDCFPSDDVIGVLTECLELSAKITDPETQGKLYNAVGLSFSQLKLFSEAAECYELALPLVHSSPRRLAVVIQNLGAVHNSLAQYRKALDYHREAAALHGSLGSRRAQGCCFCNLAYALSELGELEEAGESYLHAQQAFKDSDDSSGHWKACEGLGELKMRLRDPDKAILYYKQALALLSKCKDVSSSVQESLVNKLSEALQMKLAVQQRAPPARHAIKERNMHRQHLRIAQMRNAEELVAVHRGKEALNTHRVDDKEWRPPETCGERKPHGDMISSRATQTEGPDNINALPEANRNLNNTYEQPRHEYKNPTDSHFILQQDEAMCGTSIQNPLEITSLPPLEESPDALAPTHLLSEESTSIHRNLKSRFCTVM